VKDNAYKLLKTEAGYTLIFLNPDGREHELHRWIFTAKEFNDTADRALGSFPGAFEIACAHARGDVHSMAKPKASSLCLTSYVYLNSYAATKCSQDHLEVLRIGLKFHLFTVRSQLGFHFIEGSLREDYDDQGAHDSLAEAAQALCNYLEEFHRDERATREDNQAWQREQERQY